MKIMIAAKIAAQKDGLMTVNANSGITVTNAVAEDRAEIVNWLHHSLHRHNYD